ncbi:hypothetical protein [Hymenobacter cellulosivorans]|uniref:Uncharacterized protein n=1 Tax=Hymenobacter cellulosivorans TaxID=2932249 RepID=A0ABY4F9S1_9BACT|nr:hypothetical protein [Hymenobacter cellulosivorans]UOQ51206.1 hypothetical protein MUN80_15700 [Hymenobacter cellulosivorans]
MRSASPSLATQQALQYFQAPKSYFWHWAEGGEVVEWQNGGTICYREELQAVLSALAPEGLPPLGAVLLLLASCSDAWPGARALGVLQATARFLMQPGAADEREFYLNQTIRFLNLVHALPRELRTGPPKLHLFREVLQEPNRKTGPASLAVVLNLQQVRSQQSVDEWCSGRLDAALQAPAAVATNDYFLADLLCLDRAFQRFPSTDLLALRLRTGQDRVPEPLPELPETPPDEPTDLLDELARDVRTAGLARLTQRLVAALRIPLHTRAASEQPLGGISDVTNRGNFDRLLLSELAHDDLTLTARLINNEALYLRREAPPTHEVRPRVILLDTTLRLWGVPKVFALAAALAWARNSAHGHPPAPVLAYALGGQLAEPVDLTSLEGVIETMGRLDVALHAGTALRHFAQEQAASAADAATDGLLITQAELLHEPEFVAVLAEQKTTLRFLLTVSRDGELQLHEYQNGHRTLLSTSRFDLEELLFALGPRMPRRPLPARVLDGFTPAFLLQEPAPLFFPTVGVRVSVRNTFYHPALGVVVVTDTRRVLYWRSRSYGARELLPVMEAGSYHFGADHTYATDHKSCIYLLVSGADVLRVYFFATTSFTAAAIAPEIDMVDLSDELDPGQEPTQVGFENGCYYVLCGGRKLLFDCRRREMHHAWPRPLKLPAAGSKPDFGHVKRYINNGYSVLHRVDRLGVNTANELVVDGYEVRLVIHDEPARQELVLAAKTYYANSVMRCRAERVETQPQPDNPQLTFRRFQWADGSEAVVDTRGLLHLRSSDSTIPEITLVLVLGQPAAAWAADGATCGASYFTGSELKQSLSVADFVDRYLLRFIARLT